MAMFSPPPLVVGLTFNSLEDLQLYIKNYEEINNVVLYKKDSRKIAAARKRYPGKIFNENLIYSDITFACVHNGKYRSKATTGERPNTRTTRTGCGFEIRVKSK